MNKQPYYRIVFGFVLIAVLMLLAVAPAAAEIPVFRFVNPGDGEVISGKVEVQVFSPTDLVPGDRYQPNKDVHLILSELPGIVMTPQGENLYYAKVDSSSLPNGKQTWTAMEITWTTPPTVEIVTIDVNVKN